MFATVKGYCEKGQVFLQENAPVESKTAVIITFLTEDVKSLDFKKRIPGELKGKVSIPDDFNAPLDDLKEM